MKGTDVETLVALREDESFIREMGATETPEKVQEIFAQYNVELSAEEAEQVFEGAKKNEQNHELDEEILETVSGGALISEKELIRVGINLCCWYLGNAWYEYQEAKKTWNRIKAKKKKTK